MNTNINIEKKLFSKEDIDLLNYEILPKETKSSFYGCLIFFILIPIMPFLPARITARSAIQSMSYEKSLIMFTIINGLVIYAIYYFRIVCLKKDINEGYKYVYMTKITEKVYSGDGKFEIKITERPKNLNEKFLLTNDECLNWAKDDVLEIEFLKKRGTVLKMKNRSRLKELLPAE